VLGEGTSTPNWLRMPMTPAPSVAALVSEVILPSATPIMIFSLGILMLLPVAGPLDMPMLDRSSSPLCVPVICTTPRTSPFSSRRSVALNFQSGKAVIRFCCMASQSCPLIGWGTGPLNMKSADRYFAAAVVSLDSIACNSLLAISSGFTGACFFGLLGWYAGLHVSVDGELPGPTDSPTQF